MGFSCTIKAGKKELTDLTGEKIHYKLYGLGPDSRESTPAPYRLEAFRGEVSSCVYGDRLAAAAQDCFKTLQAMARANLASLKQDKHCETCTCDLKELEPAGWSAESCRALLAIDASEITFVQGGY